MKITQLTHSLPAIMEASSSLNLSSQEAQNEQSFYSSDVESTFHSERLQHALRTQECVRIEPQQSAPQAVQTKARNVFKTFCYTAAMTCGVLFMPSLACIAFGPIGAVAPAALFVAGLVFLMLSGEPTKQILSARSQRSAEMNHYDPR